MRTVNTEFVIAQAQHDDHADDAFSQAVKDSIEVGVVVPSILRKNLEAAGFKVVSDDASLSDYGFASTKVLKRVVIFDKGGTIVAMGAAGDAGEAIVHAALGYMRENKVGEDEAPAPLAVVPSEEE